MELTKDRFMNLKGNDQSWMNVLKNVAEKEQRIVDQGTTM
jgi:hypothetical protein